MSKKQSMKPLALAIGAALAASASVGIAQADTNPFGMSSLSSGYMMPGDAEGKCGEGKCGENKGAEGKCGEHKGAEGKCGEHKGAEGKCGEDKGAEGKCGEDKSA